MGPSRPFPFLQEDLQRVRSALVTEIDHPDDRISGPCGHLLTRPGRLFRPILTLTSAYLFAPAGPAPGPVVDAARAMEILHTATLHHDDLCDSAVLRRAQPSANAVFGDAVALLVGDYLLACCTDLATSLGDAASRLVSRTLKEVCLGQLSELVSTGALDRDEPHYRTSIAGKTACLMAASAEIGALTAGASREQQKIMSDYGHHLGMAFQIWDDVSDVWGPSTIGKALFSDIANGVYTLPVIHALRSHGDELRGLLAPRRVDDAARARILQVLDAAGSREYAVRAARTHIGHALASVEALRTTAPDAVGRLVAVAFELMPEARSLLAEASVAR